MKGTKDEESLESKDKLEECSDWSWTMTAICKMAILKVLVLLAQEPSLQFYTAIVFLGSFIPTPLHNILLRNMESTCIN